MVPLKEPLSSREKIEMTVHIVDIPVLHWTVQVTTVLGHGDLRAIEHRRFVHVIPYEEMGGTTDVPLKGELVRPVLPDSGVEEVEVGDTSWPTPTLIHPIIGRLNIISLL
jgi:hypothetical protein